MLITADLLLRVQLPVCIRDVNWFMRNCQQNTGKLPPPHFNQQIASEPRFQSHGTLLLNDDQSALPHEQELYLRPPFRFAPNAIDIALTHSFVPLWSSFILVYYCPATCSGDLLMKNNSTEVATGRWAVQRQSLREVARVKSDTCHHKHQAANHYHFSPVTSSSSSSAAGSGLRRVDEGLHWRIGWCERGALGNEAVVGGAEVPGGGDGDGDGERDDDDGGGE
ncbi:hypothetical protein RIF29_41005 [Crotalaria pallida]|uniref:Uncharacterized protein n=1 Tax=Crotalaria pallida TaxID=3830 RepID=A0AAN9E9N4_CROPI